MRVNIRRVDTCERCFEATAEYLIIERSFFGGFWQDLVCKKCAKKVWQKIRKNKIGTRVSE